MAKGKVGNAVGKTVESLGDYLKEQRVAARLSLRQLSEQAGVSNPYLSQIERGLRKPSAEVLNQIAKALRISAEQLYLRAGIVSPEDGAGSRDSTVELSILSDSGLTERQKQSLLDVYSSFLAMNAAATVAVSPPLEPLEDDDETTKTHRPPPRRRTDMAKAKFDIKSIEIPAVVARPLYAGVGAADYTVEYVRETVADVQKRFASVQKDVQKNVKDFDFEPKALRDQATTVVSTRVDALSKDAKARREAVEARVAELQADAKARATKLQNQVNDGVTTATETYVELAKRGETTVKRLRGEVAGVIDEAADVVDAPVHQGCEEVAGPPLDRQVDLRDRHQGQEGPGQEGLGCEEDRHQEGDHREEGRVHHGHRREERGRERHRDHHGHQLNHRLTVTVS